MIDTLTGEECFEIKCKGIIQDCATSMKLTHNEMVRRVQNFINGVAEEDLVLTYPDSMLRADLPTGTVRTSKKRKRDRETGGETS